MDKMSIKKYTVLMYDISGMAVLTTAARKVSKHQAAAPTAADPTSYVSRNSVRELLACPTLAWKRNTIGCGTSASRARES
jgi:hypothetical protein